MTWASERRSEYLLPCPWGVCLSALTRYPIYTHLLFRASSPPSPVAFFFLASTLFFIIILFPNSWRKKHGESGFVCAGSLSISHPVSPLGGLSQILVIRLRDPAILCFSSIWDPASWRSQGFIDHRWRSNSKEVPSSGLFPWDRQSYRFEEGQPLISIIDLIKNEKNFSFISWSSFDSLSSIIFLATKHGES